MQAPTISSLLTEAAKKLRREFELIRATNPHAGDKGEETEEILREFLNHHLPQRFRAAEGIIIDNANQISRQTDVIVYDALASPVYRYSKKTLILPVDTVAAVIEVKSRLNKPDLEDAYKKIASCKSLKKRPISEADQPATGSKLRAAGTFGVVFGFASDTSLATLAAHTEELNKKYDWRLWPNMILVLDKGVINYCIQFPGEGLSGDLMPIDSDDFLIPPFYIHSVLREDGIFSLNRFFTILLSHLTFYPRRLSTPPFEVILEGTAKEGVIIGGFQYNLQRQLLPVEVEQREIKLPSVIRITDDHGNELGVAQFFPWADGGVVKLRGKLPIEALLLTAEVKEATHVIKFGGFQYSSVLPITEADFRRWPSKMNPKMGNMRASLVQWQFVQIADEGTQEPYMARLFPGLLGIRDKVLNSAQMRKQFDAAYEPIMKSVLEVRKLMKEIANHVNAQQGSVTEASFTAANRTQVTDEIERILHRYIRHLFTTVQALVQVLLVFKLDVRFLLGAESQFRDRVGELRSSHAPLADYLEKAYANWLRRFSELARLAEGGGRILSTVEESHSTETTFPVDALRVDGKQITEFLDETFSRVASLVESTCIYAFKASLPQSLTIREIPLPSRRPDFPRRFETALRTADISPREIKYSDKRFEAQ